MKTLETKHLILRSFQMTDLDAMASIDADPKVCEFLPALGTRDNTTAGIQRIMSHEQQKGYSLYAVELKVTHEMIGWVGLITPSFEAHFTPAVEIGWRLASSHWNKGYATEGAKAVLDYAFTILGLEEVVSFTTEKNVASRRVMEKIGLQYDPKDDFNHPKLSGHKLERHALYRLKRTEYLMKQFVFKPLKNSDLNLLCQWFAKPHVREWWGDALKPDEIEEKYGKRIGDTVVCPFIAYLGRIPIAFIQFYWANKVGEGWWPDEDKNTVGIDQFIGEEDWLNRGYGTLLIQQFIRFLCQQYPEIKKIITEVDPNNLRAKRCYEKVGFQSVGMIDTPDGSAIKLEFHDQLQ
ncbi:acetyltransferase [Legionella gratiana]|uniref:Acetyltransferase n=1 Tax=Legionella gratiana TaxID=45066 RepID=A0A378J9X1_9GAMM|nr:acetyltransferase [Legionella gratiana]STX44603.1 acetyltransferase [Legionella gratiana]